MVFVGTQCGFRETLIAQTRDRFVFSRFSFEFGNPHDKKFEVQIYEKRKLSNPIFSIPVCCSALPETADNRGCCLSFFESKHAEVLG